MVKPIVHIPHQALSAPAARVTVFDTKLAALIREMKQALNSATAPRGVGLAAPQIGVSKAVFITKPTVKGSIRVFINPVIVHKSEDLTDGVPERDNRLEGCLSIPAIWGPVARSKSLTLRYQDEKGVVHEEEFTGFLATIIQHEVDHLSGILFTQRVLEQNGKLLQVTTGRDGKEVFEEVSLP